MPAKEEGTKLPYEVGAEAERLEKRKAIPLELGTLSE